MVSVVKSSQNLGCVLHTGAHYTQVNMAVCTCAKVAHTVLQVAPIAQSNLAHE